MADKKWSHCFATYHGGASYTVRNKRFDKNRRVQVSDPSLRKELGRIPGMSVEDVFADTVKAAKAAAKAAGKKKKSKLKKKVS